MKKFFGSLLGVLALVIAGGAAYYWLYLPKQQPPKEWAVNATPELIEPLAQQLTDHHWDIGHVVRTILKSNLFFSDLSIFDDLCIVERAGSSMRHRDPIVIKSFLRIQICAKMPLTHQPAVVACLSENLRQRREFIQRATSVWTGLQPAASQE